MRKCIIGKVISGSQLLVFSYLVHWLPLEKENHWQFRMKVSETFVYSCIMVGSEANSDFFEISKWCCTPADIYLLKVNNRIARAKCEICSKLQKYTYFTLCSGASIVNFEQVFAGCILDVWQCFENISVSNVQNFLILRFPSTFQTDSTWP